MDMKLNFKYVLIGILGLAWFMTGPIVHAQETTLDFYGELNDAEHPSGYRDYVEMGCWQCHGFQGQGGRNNSLAPRLLPFEAFANQVRRPRNTMPAYSQNILSDERLRAIYSYLEQIPASPEPSEIPLLSGD
jgi:mono/diheme cytochrome c family protein